MMPLAGMDKEHLYGVLRSRVVAFARRRGFSSDEADDVAHRVFLVLLQQRYKDVVEETALTKLAYGIAGFVMREFYREPKLEPIELLGPGFSDRSAGSVEVHQQTLLSQIDQMLLDRYSDRDRTIFWMYYSKGMTAREIASDPKNELTQKGVESLLLRMTRDVRWIAGVAAE